MRRGEGGSRAARSGPLVHKELFLSGDAGSAATAGHSVFPAERAACSLRGALEPMSQESAR